MSFAGRPHVDAVDFLADRALTSLAWKANQDTVDGYPLPTGGQFSTGHSYLCPDIFDSREAMHPWIRSTLLALLDSAWSQRWPDWKTFARIYLAGSLASYWWGTLDFDVLVGVDVTKLQSLYDVAGTPDAVCSLITGEFYVGLDVAVKDFVFPPDPRLAQIVGPQNIDTAKIYSDIPGWVKPLGPLEMTWYSNPDSWDIAKIHPYAAYDVTRDRWAVRPVKASNRWGAHQMSGKFWSNMALRANQIRSALDIADPVQRQAAALAQYNFLHDQRNAAFGPTGAGEMDERGLQWTVMNRWGLLGALEAAAFPDRPVGHPAPERA